MALYSWITLGLHFLDYLSGPVAKIFHGFAREVRFFSDRAGIMGMISYL